MTDHTTPTMHVLMAVDMSGSMGPRADDVRGGFNAYLDSLARDCGDGTGMRYAVTVILFDNRITRHATAASIADVPRLTEDNYAPRGSTALYDALGLLMSDFNREQTLGPQDKALLVCTTDGAENSSIVFNDASIQALMDAWAADPRRDRLFLAEGPETWRQGARMGFRPGETISLDGTAKGTRNTYAGLAYGTRSYASGAGRGATTEGVTRATGGEVH